MPYLICVLPRTQQCGNNAAVISGNSAPSRYMVWGTEQAEWIGLQLRLML